MNTHPCKSANRVGVKSAAATVRIRFTATPIESAFSVMISVRYIQVRGPNDSSKTTMYRFMQTRATVPII